LPTQEQSKAYIAFLAAMAGLSPDLPAATIFDFSLSSTAAERARGKKIATVGVRGFGPGLFHLRGFSSQSTA